MKSIRSEEPPTVAVLMDMDFTVGARVLEGVQAYAHRSVRWRILPLHSMQDALLGTLVRDRRVVGVIGSFLSDRWVGDLVGGEVPFVNVGTVSEIRSLPSVVPDDEAVGRLAARHFVERGWSRLGAVYDSASHASRRRYEGFCGAAGVPVSTPPRGTGYATDSTWEDWLDCLERPFAVFCASDFLARRLVNLLLARDFLIPEDTAVVGVGDCVLDTVLAGVSLSSVVLPAERIGERAAARLHRLLQGFPDDGGADLVPPERIAVRESSALVLGYGPVVARALAVLDEHLGQPLDMGSLAAASGASRRTLELRFRAELGQSPAAVQRARRHAQACRLLRETDLPLPEVALAVGFQEPSRFWTVFKLQEGCTPGTYRSRGPRSS